MTREEQESYTAQSELLQTMGIVWNLCEILFVEILPGKQQKQTLLKAVDTIGNYSK